MGFGGVVPCWEAWLWEGTFQAWGLGVQMLYRVAFTGVHELRTWHSARTRAGGWCGAVVAREVACIHAWWAHVLNGKFAHAHRNELPLQLVADHVPHAGTTVKCML